MTEPHPVQLRAAARGFLGRAMHAPSAQRLQCWEEVLIDVDAQGVIRALHPHDAPGYAAAVAHHKAAGTLVMLAPDQCLLPGMVDLHVHAPQWPQLGNALDLPLEDWLQNCTFPLEARCADTGYARAVYESLVDGLLANGTTTALYYASIHLEATQALADICLRRGQRALIGRVAMDDPKQCPAFYRDASAAAAEADTRAFMAYVRELTGNHGGLVLPVITPRFIPSCSDELLYALGRLVQESGCRVQTHASESDWEHAYVLQRCGMSDTAALQRFGLLTRHTVLAHGNLLSDADVRMIVASGAAVAHCPLSNVYFSDAVFPLRRMLQHGVHVGLGTDIAGGASPSLLENARHAIIASRTLESGVDGRIERGEAPFAGLAHRRGGRVLARHRRRRHRPGPTRRVVRARLPIRRDHRGGAARGQQPAFCVHRCTRGDAAEDPLPRRARRHP